MAMAMAMTGFSFWLSSLHALSNGSKCKWVGTKLRATSLCASITWIAEWRSIQAFLLITLQGDMSGPHCRFPLNCVVIAQEPNQNNLWVVLCVSNGSTLAHCCFYSLPVTSVVGHSEAFRYRLKNPCALLFILFVYCFAYSVAVLLLWQISFFTTNMVNTIDTLCLSLRQARKCVYNLRARTPWTTN